MTPPFALSRTDLHHWLHHHALPLWSGTGVDTATGTVWEALDHSGQPCTALPRRLRVQLRQAYCFARTEDPVLQARAVQLFHFAMTRGFDPDSGHLAALLAPDLTILQAPHALYDLAFLLLAAAALIEAGHTDHVDLAPLDDALDRLQAQRGWHADAAHSLPRGQNAHMHLFEATTALFAATGTPRYRDIAETCLSLFRDKFQQPGGRVLEFFDVKWIPLDTTIQTTEPGHMAEWIYLIDHYETVTGRASGVDLQSLFSTVLAARDGFGLLPDRLDPTCRTRRLWPQTELLKAALVMRRRGIRGDNAAAPEQILAVMWQQYMETDVPGGWYDCRDRDGNLLSDTMPASSLYHVLSAVLMMLQDGAVSPAVLSS
ncbi:MULTISPECIES: AGE family epimerase/isomerase [Roseobacteraceae]|uniref:AGE family epimerase/isomerase n=1 Tax=Roseobacteraceae TaxID=2854170 RepID=UPI00215D63A5|nr:AGE family epimerase/isomerase [Phaeobacter gallaeciensis]